MHRALTRRLLSTLDRLHTYHTTHNHTASMQLYDRHAPITSTTLATKFMQVLAESGSSRRSVQLYESLHGLGVEVTSLQAHWLVCAFVGAGDVRGGSDYFVGLFGFGQSVDGEVDGMDGKLVGLTPLAETYLTLMDAFLDLNDTESFTGLIEDMHSRGIVPDQTTMSTLVDRAERIKADAGSLTVYEIAIDNLLASGKTIEASIKLGNCMQDNLTPLPQSITSILLAIHSKEGWHNVFMTYKRVLRPALKYNTSIVNAGWDGEEKSAPTRRSRSVDTLLEGCIMRCLVMLYESEGLFKSIDDDAILAMDCWQDVWKGRQLTLTHMSNTNKYIQAINDGDRSISDFLGLPATKGPMTNLSDLDDRDFVDFVYCLIRLSELKGMWSLRLRVCNDLSQAGILFSNKMYTRSFLTMQMR